MNDLLRLYPGDGFALTSGVGVLQITLVLLAGILLCRLLARRNAAARYGICLVALLCVLTGPALIWLARQTGLSLVRVEIARHARPSDAHGRER